MACRLLEAAERIARRGEELAPSTSPQDADRRFCTVTLRTCREIEGHLLATARRDPQFASKRVPASVDGSRRFPVGRKRERSESVRGRALEDDGSLLAERDA